MSWAARVQGSSLTAVPGRGGGEWGVALVGEAGPSWLGPVFRESGLTSWGPQDRLQALLKQLLFPTLFLNQQR